MQHGKCTFSISATNFFQMNCSMSDPLWSFWFWKTQTLATISLTHCVILFLSYLLKREKCILRSLSRDQHCSLWTSSKQQKTLS
jgi:hypothetical protein